MPPFNQAIPLLSRPKYAEGTNLSSSRDDRNNSFLWKKGQQNSGQIDGSTQALQKLSRQVSKMRRKPLGGYIPTKPVEPFYPFKIYKPSNVSSFSTGITFLDPTSGVGTVCNIDSTKPTDFAAIPPTVNPTTDAWRLWSVRSGQVELRPLYTQLDADQASNNWCMKYTVNTNTDGVNPTTPYIGDNDFSALTNKTAFPPLIIPNAVGVGASTSFYIWISIVQDVDDTSLPYAMISATRDDSMIDTGWPVQNASAIPVGVVSNVFGGADGFGNYPLNFTVEQMIFDHQTNLFPKGNGNFGIGGTMNFRGGYNAVRGTYSPADILSQFAYPGDVIGYTASALYNVHNALYYAINTTPFPISDFYPFGGNHNAWQAIMPFDSQPA